MLSIQLDLMPLEEKPPEPPPPKSIVVRYGYLREIGEFPSDVTQKIGCGTKLVLRSERGTEIGEMLTTVCGNGGCSKSITRDKLLAYIENSGGRDYPFSEAGRVLRVATVQDLAEQSRLDEDRPRHLAAAREMVHRHNLSMKIVDVEHLLGGERILFYFVSEQRIDFRSLVRDLAHALHTRIELRQVGARDEARLTADYEKCGQHCCCKQFLKVLTPISMRSAKVQKATLDPTKISGRCGRLMCCLRYEDETYEELRKKLPKRNTRVRSEKGDGWVIDGQILTQLVLVQFDDGKREAVPMEKILEFDCPKPLMADGRIMQTPNDRPAVPFHHAPSAQPTMPPGRPPRGNGQPPAPAGRQRPRPGMPVPPRAPAGDPLAPTGPLGGDLTGQDAMMDEIDELIADALDNGPAPAAQAGPLPASDAPGKNSTGHPPAPSDPTSSSVEGSAPWPAHQQPGAARPAHAPPPRGGSRPPQQKGPSGAPRPPQQGARAPQGFRPPLPRPPQPQDPAPPAPPIAAVPPQSPPIPPADAAGASPAPEPPPPASPDSGDAAPPPA
jgi:cell fate regulator YaaT (PSP1 superfamily)